MEFSKKQILAFACCIHASVSAGTNQVRKSSKFEKVQSAVFLEGVQVRFSLDMGAEVEDRSSVLIKNCKNFVPHLLIRFGVRVQLLGGSCVQSLVSKCDPIMIQCSKVRSC